MWKTIGIIGCLISFSTTAEIYQWTDENGKTHYSDTIPTSSKTKNGIRSRDNSNLPGITTIEPTQYWNPIYDTATTNTQESNNADWNACAETKRRAVHLEKRHEVHRSEELNTWLWQNCRGYSDELRTIEQQMM